MTEVTARIRNSAKMLPPTHHMALLSPATKTRSNSGFSIQLSTPRVEPSTTMKNSATLIRGQ